MTMYVSGWLHVSLSALLTYQLFFGINIADANEEKNKYSKVLQLIFIYCGHNTAHGRVVFEQLSTSFFSFVFLISEFLISPFIRTL